jgi:uroporphyrinogen-III synthase
VLSADGDVRDLVRLLSEKLPHTELPLLYLAGEDRAADLSADLTPEGLVVHTVAVYRAAKCSSFSAEARAALTAGTLDGVLHFSRRSAEAYVDCARDAHLLGAALAPVHYCLSQQVAEPLEAAGAKQLRTPPRPNEAALLDLIEG